MTETIIAAVCTALGALALKTFDWLLNKANERKRKREEKIEQETLATQQQTADLRTELERLRTAIDTTEREMLEWRDKYWTLREQHVERLTQLTEALAKIKELTDGNNNQASPSPS